jgi:nitronate monooxygenase
MRFERIRAMWPDSRILDLFGIDLPIIQAPMAGSSTPEMAIAVSQAGGLGSLAAALLDAAQLSAELDAVRSATDKPINVNFFTHQPPVDDSCQQAAWRERLSGYYDEAGLDPRQLVAASARLPFGEAHCAVVETYRPEVVSFHFGLPAQDLLQRVRATGARIISSATTVAEARWLAERGVDAVIAQGFEAGGHRGNFLSLDLATQVGTMALVPQIADAIDIPVIAAGGIGDGRGVAAAFMLGASAAQIGTAYLFTPEAKLSPIYRAALADAADDNTALTNLFTGRPARGVINRLMREIGPISDLAPPFPTAGGALMPLRGAAEARASNDFTNVWSGQAARLARPMASSALTSKLAEDARMRLSRT